MSITASKIFDFLEQNAEVYIVRHEIASPVFGMLRHNLRQIALKLNEPDNQEAFEISLQLRVLLSKWLTVPIPFDESIKESIADLAGEAEEIQKRWGNDIREHYELALKAANDLTGQKNPVRIKIIEIIRESRINAQKFKIYCHRRAKPYFDSLLLPPDDLPIEEEAYLHTLRDYRESEPFHLMIKVGPLRSRGWGSAPDAILTAPRFCNLTQIVWSGCNDEVDFGYDPVFSNTNPSSGTGEISSMGGLTGCCPVERKLQVISSGKDAFIDTGVPDDMDELHIFRELNRYRDKRSAVLLQLIQSYGILYPPYSKILSYDPDERAHEPIDERIPGDSLTEGMFFIMPLVDKIDFDGAQAEPGYYSRAWKTKLKQEFQKDDIGLIRRLRAAGLNLLHLRNRLQHWCQPPSTVIHAPKREKHFRILLDTIGFRGTDNTCTNKELARLFQSAWKEVRRSRGEAIQAGVQAHEIIAEELLETLKKFMPEIREKSSNDKGFILNIPDKYELHGEVLFLRIIDIQTGLRVPETELKILHELNEIDKWQD